MVRWPFRCKQAETELLLERTRVTTGRCQELKVQLEDATAVQQQLRDALRSTEQELAATKGDAEGMLKLIGQLERQVAEAQSKEQRYIAAHEQAAAAVQSMAVERDQAVARENQARRYVTM